MFFSFNDEEAGTVFLLAVLFLKMYIKSSRKLSSLIQLLERELNGTGYYFTVSNLFFFL